MPKRPRRRKNDIRESAYGFAPKAAGESVRQRTAKDSQAATLGWQAG